MKWITCAASEKLYKEIRTVAQMEANKRPYHWHTRTGKPNLSKAIQMLIWMGLEAYKASPKYNPEKWDVATYMVDHDGLKPNQVNQSEINSILSTFDSIERNDE